VRGNSGDEERHHRDAQHRPVGGDEPAKPTDEGICYLPDHFESQEQARQDQRLPLSGESRLVISAASEPHLSHSPGNARHTRIDDPKHVALSKQQMGNHQESETHERCDFLEGDRPIQLDLGGRANVLDEARSADEHMRHTATADQRDEIPERPPEGSVQDTPHDEDRRRREVHETTTRPDRQGQAGGYTRPVLHLAALLEVVPQENSRSRLARERREQGAPDNHQARPTDSFEQTHDRGHVPHDEIGHAHDTQEREPLGQSQVHVVTLTDKHASGKQTDSDAGQLTLVGDVVEHP